MSWIAGNLSGFLTQQLGAKRVHGLIISNLGRFEAPVVEGKWKMDNVFFTQCDTLAGAAMGMNVVGDPAGGLNIAITWGEESLDAAFVEAFISMFRQSFHDLSA